MDTIPRIPDTIFNGKYTIEWPDGNHKTFRIHTQPDDADFAPKKRIISILNGPDNERNYDSFGFVTDIGIFVWRKRQTNPNYQAWAKGLWSLAVEQERSWLYVKGYRLHLSASCIICSRTLTTPESIRAGIGPICAEMAGAKDNIEF